MIFQNFRHGVCAVKILQWFQLGSVIVHSLIEGIKWIIIINKTPKIDEGSNIEGYFMGKL